MAAPEDRVNLVRTESDRFKQYLGTLSPEDWCHPSACDAWEARDVVAHLIIGVDMYTENISRGVGGDSSPPSGVTTLDAEGMAARMKANAQRAIALRESLGEQLLHTFSERCDALNRLLAGLGSQDWDKLCFHPAAVIPVRTFVDLRIAELAVHEWDIRSKLEVSSPVSAPSLRVIMDLMPGFIVGRLFRPGAKLSAPVRFRIELTGAAPGSQDITVEGGQARMEPSGAAAPDVTLRCDTETFVLLAYGRVTAVSAISDGRITVEGDRGLAAQISE